MCPLKSTRKKTPSTNRRENLLSLLFECTIHAIHQPNALTRMRKTLPSSKVASTSLTAQTLGPYRSASFYWGISLPTNDHVFEFVSSTTMHNTTHGPFRHDGNLIYWTQYSLAGGTTVFGAKDALVQYLGYLFVSHFAVPHGSHQ